MSDTLNHLLAGLPPAEPSPARAAETRLRCRAQMARHARPAAPVKARAGAMGQLWQPLAAILGVAYMTDVIVEAFRVLGRLVD